MKSFEELLEYYDDKINEARELLPLPSEAVTRTYLVPVRRNEDFYNIIEEFPDNPDMPPNSIIHIEFKKEYVGNLAVGWKVTRFLH